MLAAHAQVLVSDSDTDEVQSFSTISNLLDLIDSKSDSVEKSYVSLDREYNERPIIGIVSQTSPIQYEDYTTYIPTTYIKFVEQSGARAVPILINKYSDNQIIELLSHLNGVLFTGGEMVLIDDEGNLSEFSRKNKVILDTVKEYNDKGIHYPVWAVCQGFQMVSVIEAPFPDVLLKNYFDSENISNNITFDTLPTKTKLFKNMPQHIVNSIQKKNITYNYHVNGVLPESYTKYPGLQDYTVIAHSYDLKGVKYVASIEHKKYPIFAVQFHPEKNIHVWSPNTGSNIPHDPLAIEMSQYFSNFFISEARKNFNQFRTPELEAKARIENYFIYFDSTMMGNGAYLFKE